MPRVEFVTRAQMDQVIGQFDRLGRQLGKQQQTIDKTAKFGGKFLKSIKTAAGHLATAYITFQGIARVQDEIRKIAEEWKTDLEEAGEIAKAIQEARAPQFMFEKPPANLIQDWRRAWASGIPIEEIEDARTALMAMLPEEAAVKRVLDVSLALKELAPAARLEDIATGIGDIANALPSFTKKDISATMIFFQRWAKGQFQNLLQPMTRGMALGAGLGMKPEQGAGLMAAMTMGPWEQEKALMAFRRFMLQAIKKPTPEIQRVWKRLGLAQADAWGKLQGIAAAQISGELTPEKLEAMFGQRQFIPIFETLRHWNDRVVKRIKEMSALLGQADDEVGLALRRMYRDPRFAKRLEVLQSEQGRRFAVQQLEQSRRAERLATNQLEMIERALGGGPAWLGRVRYRYATIARYGGIWNPLRMIPWL